MKLHTGSLLWPGSLPQPPGYPALTEDIECEVLVIGGGEAGALAAYHMLLKGIDTVLVEKRTIGAGISSANTGLLQYGNDKHLTACIHSFGEEKGVRFYKLCRTAVNDLSTICSNLAIDAQFIRRDSLYFASDEHDLAALKEEYETLLKHGFDVAFLNAQQISRQFSFGKPGAIYSKDDAELNPFRFTHSLIHDAVQRGLRVYENTEMIGRENQADGVIFHTGNHRIKAKKAIFSTGYETQQIISNRNAVLSSSYAIATQPIDHFTGWHERCLIWETARPYLYLRTTADNRIVAGGLDENTAVAEERDRKLLHKGELLLAEVQRLFPEIEGLRAEYCWGAVFGSTHDGLPLIGTQAAFPHCYFGLGYGGNGTVYNTIAAQILAGLISEGHHPDAELFRFDRPVRTPAGIL